MGIFPGSFFPLQKTRNLLANDGQPWHLRMFYLLLGAFVLLFVALLCFKWNKCSIKRAAFAALRLYQRATRFWLMLRGLTPQDVAQKRIVTGAVWEEFCDALKAAGAGVLSSDVPQDSVTAAEGVRYLSRLTRAALENFVECANVRAPVLCQIVDGTRACPIKMGADNPDNFYQHASIDGRYEYELTGFCGTVSFLSIGVQQGQYGKPGGLRTLSILHRDALVVGPGGALRVILSHQRPAEANVNWLPLPPVTSDAEEAPGLLIVRQTLLDRVKETLAELRVVCTSPCAGPSLCTAERMDEGFHSASLLVVGAAMLFKRWTGQMRSKHPNQLPLFDPQTSTNAGGDPRIAYYHSYWKLAEDEVLVIEASPQRAEAEYWNFQLNNHWMESLDYRHHRIHVNKHMAVYREDGRVVIVVGELERLKAEAQGQRGSKELHPALRQRKGREEGDEKGEVQEGDIPAHWNVLDTVGHRVGTMCFRWQGAKDWPATLPPAPRTRVVRMAQLWQEHL